MLTVLLALALGKPTEQSSTFQLYGAQLAVYGNRGTHLLQEECTYTGGNDTNPWWRVDLLTLYTIISGKILNRGIDAGGGKCSKWRYQVCWQRNYIAKLLLGCKCFCWEVIEFLRNITCIWVIKWRNNFNLENIVL